ncbi:hypothetical protein [Roseovarius salinarum]|uniref:hypothetical protein n=1 Tax=Roseovarius salinarum TaxID=1981892 RepID=UPI000C3307EC|nr:hypothetical protein [Roseovarius salinarum]
MKIMLSPVRRDGTLTLVKSGDTLTINGEDFDFSGVPEGATLPRGAVACDSLCSDVTREDGELCLTLTLPLAPDAPDAGRFPAPVHAVHDGPIPLPGGEK